MTHLDKYKQLLSETGVGFDETQTNDRVILKIEAGESDLVVGHMFFETEFVFSSADGSLVEIGIWE